MSPNAPSRIGNNIRRARRTAHCSQGQAQACSRPRLGHHDNWPGSQILHPTWQHRDSRPPAQSDRLRAGGDGHVASRLYHPIQGSGPVRSCDEANAVFVPMTFEKNQQSNMSISVPSMMTDYSASELPILVQEPQYFPRSAGRRKIRVPTKLSPRRASSPWLPSCSSSRPVPTAKNWPVHHATRREYCRVPSC